VHTSSASPGVPTALMPFLRPRPRPRAAPPAMRVADARRHARAAKPPRPRCRDLGHGRPRHSAHRSFSCSRPRRAIPAAPARLRPPDPAAGRGPTRTGATASDGFMQMDKITYRSKAGDMDIPGVRVFSRSSCAGAKSHPAIVWVHENIPRPSLRGTTSPTSAKPPPRATSSSPPEYRGSHRPTARPSTTRSTTAASKWTIVVTAVGRVEGEVLGRRSGRESASWAGATAG